MQKRHSDRKLYFEEQVCTTEKYVIPFIEQIKEVKEGMSVLEIGCGEAGNLKPFLDRRCKCLGIDLNTSKIEMAKEFYADHAYKDNLSLISEDIYKYKHNEGTFDIIVMRDFIEHIPNQERFINQLGAYANENTVVFFAFPPWQNPFGGHQQVCQSRLLSRLPYFHLLPKKLYRGTLNVFKERQSLVDELLEIKETGLSIERFEKIMDNSPFKIEYKVSYFINPNYEIKFGLKPRVVYKVVDSMKYLRNFTITCLYCVATLK
ncbi:class I SAM-dependent methyltransferase [Paludibacter sp. 221]|uniref:class I SAM-dependent methyltransferase n=1 Tax=Paludibacter sp. 221 TaxID=2302939 RepID=UPI0013D4CCFA|nr:class I SAM-dependent methyltransferase [Paludibacter sp. 221]NDV47551.1 class I SAM-dependent methyltransferase [Paludibacter sp. 221]